MLKHLPIIFRKISRNIFTILNTHYNEFFNVVKEHDRNIVRAVTSAVNKISIAFHTKMGFEIVKGDSEIDGVSVHTNYDGSNQGRVLFEKNLD